MPKNSLEKVLEKYQKEAAKNVKKKIQADKRLAENNEEKLTDRLKWMQDERGQLLS